MVVAGRRSEVLAAAAVGLGAFVVYAATLAPSLPGGDAGELIVTAAGLGVPHPPGYPLYTLLAHLVTHLPFGTLAWRVALLSAACGAGAAALLCRAAAQWTGRVAAGVLAGGLFALSPLTWRYATEAEVFALNDLLLAVQLWLAVRFARSGAPRAALWGALVAGLALSNHHTAVFLVAPLGVWALVRGRAELLRPRRLLALAGLFALGLLPYAYLPLAALSPDAPVWGDPTTPSGFLAHLLRTDYGTFQLARDDFGARPATVALLGHYAAGACERLLYLGPLLALGGLWAALRRRPGAPAGRGLPLALAAALGGYLVVFLALSNLDPADPLLASVLARFWLLPDLLLAWFAALGLAALGGWRPRLRPALLPVALALVAAQGARNAAPALDRDPLIADYGAALLGGLPAGALLLTLGDLPTNAARYAQVGGGVRPDVVVLDQELLTFPWAVARAARRHPDLHFPGTHYHPREPGGFTLAALVAANPARPSFVYAEPKRGDPSVSDLALWPEGLPQRVLPRGAPFDREAWDTRATALLAALTERFAAPRPERAGADPWEGVVVADYWAARHRHALAWVTEAVAAPTDRRALDAARAAYESLVAAHPAPPWYAWKNLGMVYERLATDDPALFRPKLVAAWQRYLETAPATEPDRATVAAALRRYAAPR